MEIRNLHRTDLKNPKFRTQFFQLLGASEMDEGRALFVFNEREDSVMTFVGTDDNEMPIATVSLVLEQKYTWDGILCGHIEDVNTHPDYRRKGLGTEIMKYAMSYANRFCQRVVLECKPELEAFYQTHEFITHSIAMRKQKMTEPNISRKIEDTNKESLWERIQRQGSTEQDTSTDPKDIWKSP